MTRLVLRQRLPAASQLKRWAWLRTALWPACGYGSAILDIRLYCSSHTLMKTSRILCACGCGGEVKRVRYPNSQRQARFINTHQHQGASNGNFKGGKEKRCCPVCLKEFSEWPSQIAVTCGNDACYRQWQRLTTAARGQNKVPFKCERCGSEKKVYPSQAKTRRFCSDACRAKVLGETKRGENAKNWRGGKLQYMMKQARLRDGEACRICGFSLATDVHHITPRSAGGQDVLSNLITLCPNHHRLAHMGTISVEHLRQPEAA